MKEHPIIFSAPMVGALLERRKTQTRRVMKVQPNEDSANCYYSGPSYPHEGGGCSCKPLKCPYGQPGDRLFVKEAAWVWCRKVKNGTTAKGRQKYAYRQHGRVEDGSVIYAADQPAKPSRTTYAEPDMVWRYKHARYCPKALSRITLEITDVCVERLQDISDEDAIAEGIAPVIQMGAYNTFVNYAKGMPAHLLPRESYRTLWNSINGEGAWDANPWIWALTFKVL